MNATGGVSGATRLRVRYAETDQMGVVYHANYLVWFEIGRVELLRAVGHTYRDLEAGGINLPVIRVECDYRRPARYDDELEVRTTGRLISALRVEFRYQLVRVGDDEVLATARTEHVAVNREGRPCRLGQTLREALA